MKITRFALGIRFAAMAEQPHKEFARKIFEGIFSVLTLSELEDLTVYGGADPFSPANAEGERRLPCCAHGRQAEADAQGLPCHCR